MIELPAHLSYSGLNSYTTCGYRYWVERLVGKKGDPSWALLGGSAIHEMTADYDQALKPREFEAYLEDQLKYQVAAGVDEDQISATGRASKEWPDKRNKAWWLANGPVMFNKWVNWSQACPWQALILTNPDDADPIVRETWGSEQIELAIEFEVSGYIGDNYIKAYVDRAYVLPSGEPVVLDIKTGTSKPVDALQLGIYAALMEKTIGVRPQYGYFWMAESGGTLEPVNLDRYTEDYLDSQFSAQMRGLKAGVFLPHVTAMCSACGVRKFCPAVGGERASEIPTPVPVS